MIEETAAIRWQTGAVTIYRKNKQAGPLGRSAAWTILHDQGR
jgi:hypothetical protein